MADSYFIDFEKTPANTIIQRVESAAVKHLAGNAPKSATVPLVGKRRSGTVILQAQVAKVVSVFSSKRLVASSDSANVPAAQGGRVKLTFTNFDPNGVTLTSLTLSNLSAPGATLTFYYADGSSSQQSLGTTAAGGSLVVPLNVKGVAAVDVNAPTAFAVDDVRFTDEVDAPR